MDWENGFAVSEREVIDIKIRHKFGVFFCYIYDYFNNLKNYFFVVKNKNNKMYSKLWIIKWKMNKWYNIYFGLKEMNDAIYQA